MLSMWITYDTLLWQIERYFIPIPKWNPFKDPNFSKLITKNMMDKSYQTKKQLNYGFIAFLLDGYKEGGAYLVKWWIRIDA